MSQATIVTTPCKINLHLGVHQGRDERGYHRVDSVMVPVALFDTVSVERAPELAVSFSPELGIPAEKTGVWKAATMLADALGVHPLVGVHVEACIPERAGLGGSSADAGATLRALAELWGVDPLLYLGAGDALDRTFPGLEMPVVLVMPRAEGGSTPEAYAEFDRSGEKPACYEDVCAALGAGDIRGVVARLHNNLAGAAMALCPPIADVLGWLQEQDGVLAAQVTGSGTCSFAICESDGAAREAASRAKTERGWRAWATKTLA